MILFKQPFLTRFKIISIIFFGLFIACYSLSLYANTFPKGTQYQTCFTPQQNCVSQLVKHINQAKRSIYVQAYAFTDHKIGNALAAAKRRDVKVYIILDKSNFLPKAHTSAYYLMRRHVPTWDDNTVRIAHNKIMIFDRLTVETGSFNYTWSAQHKNAENMLFIKNKQLAQQYLNNWLKRVKISKPMNPSAKSLNWGH